MLFVHSVKSAAGVLMGNDSAHVRQPLVQFPVYLLLSLYFLYQQHLLLDSKCFFIF